MKLRNLVIDTKNKLLSSTDMITLKEEISKQKKKFINMDQRCL